ncbi:hypothetical protein [Sinomonas flava]
MRDAGTGGDADKLLNRAPRTVVIEDVELVSSPTSGAKGGAIDMSPGQGTVMLFNRVTFDAYAQPQAISAVLGKGTNTDPGTTVTFADCTIIANKSIPAGASDRPTSEAHPVGLTDFGGGSQDRFFWYGGTFDVAGFAPLAGEITANYEALAGGKPAVQWFVDPKVSVKDQTKGAGVHSVEEAEPEIPKKGVSREEERAYLPDFDSNPSSGVALTPSARPTQKGTLAAGRIYYVKVRVTEAMRPIAVRIGVGSGPGKVAAGFYLDQAGEPASDGNLRGIARPVEAREGEQSIQLQARRRIWPGHRYVWIAFATSNSATTVDVVADAVAAGFTVKYQDGWDGVSALGAPGSLSDLPAGQPAPIPALVPFGSQ